MIIFGSVWFLSKKSNQTEFFFLKKLKPVQTDRFRFDFLGKKQVQTGLTRFFQFGSVFSGFARFFSGLGSVRFFRFQAYKTKTEPNWPVFLKF